MFRWLYAPGNVPCRRWLPLLFRLRLRLRLEDPLEERFDRRELVPDRAGLITDILPARRRRRAGVAFPKKLPMPLRRDGVPADLGVTSPCVLA